MELPEAHEFFPTRIARRAALNTSRCSPATAGEDGIRSPTRVDGKRCASEIVPLVARSMTSSRRYKSCAERPAPRSLSRGCSRSGGSAIRAAQADRLPRRTWVWQIRRLHHANAALAAYEFISSPEGHLAIAQLTSTSRCASRTRSTVLRARSR
jgi:hypothetical protein